MFSWRKWWVRTCGPDCLQRAHGHVFVGGGATHSRRWTAPPREPRSRGTPSGIQRFSPGFASAPLDGAEGSSGSRGSTRTPLAACELERTGQQKSELMRLLIILGREGFHIGVQGIVNCLNNRHGFSAIFEVFSSFQKTGGSAPVL